ncbi:carboxypeptidase-like regulatory domain-containing protein [Kibdelosporangium phytohabitans]|nr:carboxypeptidase-like regulatory domain-containing protein [Kibdelosporangium phytohabitans]MBE1471869.1 hypothetical protein [Kibdelosporangium phytohabitans]
MIAVMLAAAPVATAQPPLDSRIVGQLTKSTGEPVPNARVTAQSTTGWFRHDTQTGADGKYVLPGVTATGEQYKVRFDPWMGPVSLPTQWAHRKRTEAEADVVAVRPGEDTVVDDALFAAGTVTFTASAVDTGEPVRAFCAELSPTRRGCTTTAR